MPKLPNRDPHVLGGPRWTDLSRYRPTDADVDALIARASGNSPGLDFLLSGELDSVAIWFRIHAFTVLAARERLAKGAVEPPPA